MGPRWPADPPGGVMTIWHQAAEADVRSALELLDDVVIGATIPLGRPVGSHGPVRRRPLADLVYEDEWGAAPAWAVDPAGTATTGGRPPR